MNNLSMGEIKMGLDNVHQGQLILINTGVKTFCATIQRLTKTQIVTEKGSKFNRNTGYLVGDDSFSRTFIYSVDHATVGEFLEHQSQLKRKERLLKVLSNVTETNTEIWDKIAQALGSVEKGER